MGYICVFVYTFLQRVWLCNLVGTFTELNIWTVVIFIYTKENNYLFNYLMNINNNIKYSVIIYMKIL